MYDEDLSDLPQGCQNAIEDFLSGTSSESHSDCSTCSDLIDAFRDDQKLLVGYFRHELAEPREIDFRDPLLSASGHPRRVSLSILPILLLLLLSVLVAVDLISIGLLKHVNSNSAQLATRNEILRLEESLWALDPATVDPADIDWEILIAGSDLFGPDRIVLAGAPPRKILLDPFGRPYLILEADARFQIYSAGKNGTDENGGGDDVVSPRIR